MKIDKNIENEIYLSYIRASDYKIFSYKCKIKGNRIIWASATGRWRSHASDSIITFTIEENIIIVKDKFSDGSENKEIFTLKQLGK